MNTFKVIVIGILSIYFIGIANAQESKTQSNNQQTTKPAASTQETPQELNTVIIYDVKTKVQEIVTVLTSKVLKKEIQNKLVIINADNKTQTLSLSVDTAKIKLSDIEKRLHNEGYILSEKKEIAIETKPQMPVEKYNPEIDKFLNIEDVSIFTTAFQSYNLRDIHPSRRSFYQMVEKIHNFDEALKNVEISLSDKKINEVSQAVGIPREAAKNSLLDAAKTEITQAEQYLDGLNPFGKELDLLSPHQKQLYNSLKDKFNDLYNKIYPE